MTCQVPSKDLCSQLRALPAGNRLLGYTAAEEIERLQRLLDARPPYYCKRCDCASCGNTRPAHEPPVCRCIPLADRPWKFCQDCGGLTQPPGDGQ